MYKTEIYGVELEEKTEETLNSHAWSEVSFNTSLTILRTLDLISLISYLTIRNEVWNRHNFKLLKSFSQLRIFNFAKS